MCTGWDNRDRSPQSPQHGLEIQIGEQLDTADLEDLPPETTVSMAGISSSMLVIGPAIQGSIIATFDSGTGRVPGLPITSQLKKIVS